MNSNDMVIRLRKMKSELLNERTESLASLEKLQAQEKVLRDNLVAIDIQMKNLIDQLNLHYDLLGFPLLSVSFDRKPEEHWALFTMTLRFEQSSPGKDKIEAKVVFESKNCFCELDEKYHCNFKGMKMFGDQEFQMAVSAEFWEYVATQVEFTEFVFLGELYFLPPEKKE